RTRSEEKKWAEASLRPPEPRGGSAHGPILSPGGDRGETNFYFRYLAFASARHCSLGCPANASHFPIATSYSALRSSSPVSRLTAATFSSAIASALVLTSTAFASLMHMSRLLAALASHLTLATSKSASANTILASRRAVSLSRYRASARAIALHSTALASTRHNALGLPVN